MKSRRNVYSIALLALVLSLSVSGCKKKVAAAPPPPPPKPIETKVEPPARPVVATFEAEPRTIERGQSATLRWSVTGETTEIAITPGVGAVSKEGSRQVFPAKTQTYTLTAKGPGGAADMTASVTVTEAVAPPPPPKPKETPTISEILSRDVQDAYFDYDSSAVREDARSVLTRNADALKNLFGSYPNAVITVEGHADERGSAEYNLGLADRRATAAKEFLVQLGVSGERLNPVSFGKERPQCTESNESCWQLNRRAHFSPGQ